MNAETLARELTNMDRDTLIAYLHHLDCSFPLDFTDEYLKSMSIERLQHVALAAGLHAEHPTAHL